MKYILVITLLTILPINIIAQEHDHEHGRNEIGISPGVNYSPSHNGWGFGIHAHYFRTLSERSPWALGASIEQVFSHGTHSTISIGGKYEIFDKLNFVIMPGITFFKHNHEHAEAHEHTSKPQFSIHLELGYDLIHWKHFHLGPAIDYAWSRHDNHIMLGIHCAYNF